jgi:hypothetical protein
MPSSYHFLEIHFIQDKVSTLSSDKVSSLQDKVSTLHRQSFSPRQRSYSFIGQSFFSPRQSFYPSSTKFLLSKSLPFIGAVPSFDTTTKLFEEMKRQDKEANNLMLDRSTFSVSPLPNLLDLANTNLSASQKELLLWHQRYGHASF